MTVPPFVDAEWVRTNRDRVVVADTRWFLDGRDAHAAYLDGHLPGAVFVDLDTELAGAPDAPTEGRHPLPTPEAFAEAMSRHGIGDDDVVVAYDQGPGAIAARLVWMLRVTGHDAAVLDGGIGAWDGPLEEGPVAREPAAFSARPWPDRATVDADAAAAIARAPSGRLVDAREPARYRGEHEPVDPRPGHIPGALNVPFTDNLGEDGRLRSDDELRRRYADVLGASVDRVAVYCGSGVTACHDVLVLERLGVDARLYPGSYSAWSNDPDREVATGDA